MSELKTAINRSDGVISLQNKVMNHYAVQLQSAVVSTDHKKAILREMQLAIDHAYDHHDKEAQKLWDMMSFKSDRPTPEEFIFQVAMMLDKNGSLH